MKVKLPALTWKEGEVYVADCPAVKIASQGDTEEEAVANLREAIELYFEEEPTPNLPAIEDAHVCDLEVNFAS